MSRCVECGDKLFPNSVPCDRCEDDICGACCEMLNEESKWDRKVHDDTDCEEGKGNEN
jgi:hypothetical protein